MKKTIYVRDKKDWQGLLDESKRSGLSVSRIISDAVHVYFDKPSLTDTPSETYNKLVNINKEQLNRIEGKLDRLLGAEKAPRKAKEASPEEGVEGKTEESVHIRDAEEAKKVTDPFFRPMPKGKK